MNARAVAHEREARREPERARRAEPRRVDGVLRARAGLARGGGGVVVAAAAAATAAAHGERERRAAPRADRGRDAEQADVVTDARRRPAEFLREELDRNRADADVVARDEAKGDCEPECGAADRRAHDAHALARGDGASARARARPAARPRSRAARARGAAPAGVGASAAHARQPTPSAADTAKVAAGARALDEHAADRRAENDGDAQRQPHHGSRAPAAGGAPRRAA